MTTEEAIEMLKRWVKSYRYVASKDKNGFWAKNYRKDAEALEMAIEALSKQNCDGCGEIGSRMVSPSKG